MTVLKQIHRALKPDGVFLLTVPQHAWLWSSTDEYAHHERRYSSSELNARLLQTGIKVLRSTSFVTALLSAMIFSQFFHRENPSAELKISPVLNSVFEKVLHMEHFFIKRGVNFPVGGSRLVLVQKA